VTIAPFFCLKSTIAGTDSVSAFSADRGDDRRAENHHVTCCESPGFFHPGNTFSDPDRAAQHATVLAFLAA